MTKHSRRGLSRRQLLGLTGVGASCLLLDRVLPGFGTPLAHAGGHGVRGSHATRNGAPPLFVYLSFNGGWDTLLTLDPRSLADFGDPDAKVYAGYDLLGGNNDPEIDDALNATNGTGVFRPDGTDITFGPSTPSSFRAHVGDLCVLRGVDMGSLTHEVGRRYFLTGKFPRGLAANGSSLGTWVADQNRDAETLPLPNLVLGVETYNEGLDPVVSGVSLRQAADMEFLMQAISPELDPGPMAKEAIESYLDEQNCARLRLDGAGRVTTFQASRPSALELGKGTLYPHFDFASGSAEITALMGHFGITTLNGLSAEQRLATENAMLAAQCLAHGISHAVSVRLAEGIDHHDDLWVSDHSLNLRAGFDAAAGLLSFLKATPDPAGGGGTLFDRTVVLMASEFARTPDVNARGGRDHHLANACVLAGMGIQGGALIGGTTDTQYGAELVDFATGGVTSDGQALRPADVHATVLDAMGLPRDHLANQEPRIISAALS